MTTLVPIPTDRDGFLRRECPHCKMQFKWHHGPWNEVDASAPHQSAFYCPLCGKSADAGAWWTTEQCDYRPRHGDAGDLEAARE
jgi:endogenous inhibitor of DNA gyrase (YacG/DUF329 family)